jgi:hypothetical protein
MKKLLVALCMTCALALAARAGEGEAPKKEGEHKKPEMTAEQKAFRKEMTEKYDANKSGKLDKEERANMTPEEKDKWKALFPPKKKTEGEPKKEGENKEGEKK